MKKLLLGAVLFSTVAAFGQAGKTYVINGNVKGIKDTVQKVMVSYSLNGDRVSDSAMVTNGVFTLSHALSEPVKALLYVKFKSTKPELQKVSFGRDAKYVYLQPGVPVTVTAKDSFAIATVKGGVMNIELAKIEAQEKVYDDKMEPLYADFSAARKAGDKEKTAAIEKQIDAIDSAKTEDVYGKYIAANPTSPIAVFVLRDYAGYAINADKIQPLFDKLPAAQKQYSFAQEFKKQLDIAAKTGIGKMAMDFTQNDTLNKPVSLSNFKGKYVLLDFWASWCGPCRRENPNVVAAYNKYKEKGFSILSVSLDQPGAKEKWIKAIHDDNLTWTHVSDLKFWDNEVAKEYGIQAIPQNFLIDPDGKIVGKDLRGEDLDNKLAGIFAN